MDSPAHISPGAPSVLYVPFLFDPSHPRAHPCALPAQPHHIDTHRPLKQDVQKLVFSIKQCRALT